MNSNLKQGAMILKKAMTRHVAIRLAVTASLCALLALVRGWYGDHSPLVGGLVSGAVFIGIELWCMTESQRQALFSQASELVLEHRMTAAKWGCYILCCWYFVTTRSDASEPAVKQLQSLVETSGLIVVFFVPFCAMVIGMLVRGSGASFSNSGSSFLRGLAVLSLTLWLLGARGDDVYKWVMSHPADACMAATALFLVGLIARFSVSSIVRDVTFARTCRGPMRDVHPSKPTERDNHYTAAHEAGHALVYAALGRLPNDVKVSINKEPDEDGVLGFVTGIVTGHRLEEKSFAEWYMLVLLGGQVGERVMHGETTLGSKNDMLRWLGVARIYLANHYRGIYYSEPKDKFEQEQNHDKLEALHGHQATILQSFFIANEPVFKELADELLEKRLLRRDDLVPLLSRVKLTEDFPLPFGPFETFSKEWLEEAKPSV